MADKASDYRIHIVETWSALPADWQGFMQAKSATPFQSAAFLTSWYETLALLPGTRPLIVEVRDGVGRPAVLLPLVMVMEGNLRVIRFADAGVSDNHAPVLGPGAPVSEREARLLWACVRAALPVHDLIFFDKLTEMIGERPNPLALLAGVNRSALSVHPLQLGEDWEAYTRSRKKTIQKDLKRKDKVFQSFPGARFAVIYDIDEALRLFEKMEEQQSKRLRGQGKDYRLDAPHYRAFYRRLLHNGLASRALVFAVLRVNEELIGAFFGIADSARIVLVRLSHGGDAWRKCSPGRLVIERVLKWAHGAGYRLIDFSIGDHDYKQGFGVTSVPLYELITAGSWRGVARAMGARVKAVARRSSLLSNLRRSLRHGAPTAGSSPWLMLFLFKWDCLVGKYMSALLT